LKGRLRLSDAERAKLGKIGHRLGRKALGEVATAWSSADLGWSAASPSGRLLMMERMP
jgi:hypothetical protein